MFYNTHTLNSGLRIMHIKSPSPVVYLGYAIAAGTRQEAGGEQGLAHFLEHATFKGTRKRKARLITSCLDGVGGDVNAYTNKEGTVYYAAILREHLARAVDLLSDMVFHSVYPEDELEKEKDVVLEEIESYNDSPSDLIYDEFENLLFQNHPLGHNILGTKESVKALTREQVAGFAKRYYTPENMVFFASGDVDFQRLVGLLERQTQGFAPRKPTIRLPKVDRPAPESRPAESGRQTVELKRGTHQAHVMIGARSYDVFSKKRLPLYLLNNIVGGAAMNSLLNMRLRERLALVYTVESSFVCYSDMGLWSTYFGTETGDVKRCLGEAFKVLQGLCQKPVSQTRLAAAKRQIRGQIAIAAGQRESFVLDAAKSFLFYGWEKDISRLVEDIKEITADELLQVAREVMQPERLSVLVYK